MIPIYLNINGKRYLSGKSENSLLNPKYRGKSLWIAARFDASMLSARPSTAPTKTSIYASGELRYFHIAPTEFSRLKMVGEERSGCLQSFLDGNAQRLSSLEDVPLM